MLRNTSIIDFFGSISQVVKILYNVILSFVNIDEIGILPILTLLQGQGEFWHPIFIKFIWRTKKVVLQLNLVSVTQTILQ